MPGDCPLASKRAKSASQLICQLSCVRTTRPDSQACSIRKKRREIRSNQMAKQFSWSALGAGGLAAGSSAAKQGRGAQNILFESERLRTTLPRPSFYSKETELGCGDDSSVLCRGCPARNVGGVGPHAPTGGGGGAVGGDCPSIPQDCGLLI